MLTLKQITLALALIFALLSTALAQESNPIVQGSSLTITANASGERVRITAPSSMVQMHVEVYAVSGEKLFDQEIRGGNVFDWHLQDGQAQRLAPGTYVCVVTVKSISGKLTQRIGTVSIEEKSVSVQAADSKQLSAAQAQPIGPVEENPSWTIAAQDEPQTGTVIANDGTDGQMIRGRGALTFRIGNFFSGIDTEQMRLTEAGNLGIGTSEPKAKLEVAGTIRAERFLVAKPGQTSNAAGDPRQTTDDAGSVQPLVSGSGTQNQIAKWIDNSATLGNSGITETATGVGIGTPTPTQALDVANGRIVTTGSQTLAGAFDSMLEVKSTITNNGLAQSAIKARNIFNGSGDFVTGLDAAPTFAPSASINTAQGFVAAAFFAPPPGVTITNALGGASATVYSNTTGAVTNGTAFNVVSPFVFGALKPTNQYGLRINNQGIAGTTNSYGLFVDAQSGSTNSYSAIFAGGNVGIGTSNPTNGKLEVSSSSGTAVYGASSIAAGVSGVSTSPTGAGVSGFSNNYGVSGVSSSGVGVGALSVTGVGLRVQSGSGNLVEGYDGFNTRKFFFANNGTLNLPADGLVAGTNQLVLSGGKVGIGTTDTTLAKLSIESGSANALFAFSTSGVGVWARAEGSRPALVVQNVGTGNLVEGSNMVLDGGFHITNDGTYVAGSDFAEALPARGNRAAYQPGDVLVVSTKTPGKVEKASQPYDQRVAGIYSTRPGMLGADKNGTSRVDKDEVPVAIVGIVPTKVSAMNGSIRVGDLLTTSSTPGYAMRCSNRVKCVGAIVGKALEPLAEGKGVIKVLVMLR